MVKPKLPDWEIRITRLDGLSAGKLERIFVPQSRMSKVELADFVRALMARHSGFTAQELLSHFVNRRKGKPERDDSWELRQYTDVEGNTHGYFCAAHPLFASASLPMSDAERQFYLKTKEENGIS